MNIATKQGKDPSTTLENDYAQYWGLSIGGRLGCRGQMLREFGWLTPGAVVFGGGVQLCAVMEQNSRSNADHHFLRAAGFAFQPVMQSRNARSSWTIPADKLRSLVIIQRRSST